MYKSRIAKWKLDKKNKEAEVGIILRKKTDRDAVGKATCFRLRGKDVDMDDMLRFSKRKGRSFQPAPSDAATPSDLSCWTPERLGSPLPRPVIGDYEGDNSSFSQANFQYAGFRYGRGSSSVSGTLPDFASKSCRSTIEKIYPPRFYLVQLQLLTFTKAYIDRSFGTGRWYINSEGRLLSTGKKIPEFKPPSMFSMDVSIAVGFMYRGMLVEARQALSFACNVVESFMVSEEPRALETPHRGSSAITICRTL